MGEILLRIVIAMVTMTTAQTEKEVVESFLSTRGNDAFAALAAILFGRLTRYFSIRGLDIETAEELTQDVLLTIYQKAEALRSKEHFYGWVFKIARNQHLQHVRRRRKKVELVDLDTLVHPSQLTAAGKGPEEAKFLCWIAPLESDTRQIMILRYVEELSYQEIATALDIPLGTVKWKIFDAKMKLTDVLAQSRGRTL